MITLQALCFGILGYLLGATPYGLIIARVFCHTDPRTGGSHNTGATNVARMCGFGWGVATLACDLLKGALPVFLAQMETGSPVVVTVAALSAVLRIADRGDGSLTHIGAEGSLFQKSRRFRPALDRAMESYAAGECGLRFDFLTCQNTTLIGTACAALLMQAAKQG